MNIFKSYFEKSSFIFSIKKSEIVLLFKSFVKFISNNSINNMMLFESYNVPNSF